jgi:hypothetical protein
VVYRRGKLRVRSHSGIGPPVPTETLVALALPAELPYLRREYLARQIVASPAFWAAAIADTASVVG